MSRANKIVVPGPIRPTTTMSSFCPLIKDKCVRERFDEEPCAKHPTLEDAASCINHLKEMLLESHVEIRAQDDVIERLKSMDVVRKFAS